MEGNQIFQLEQVDPPRPGTEHSPPPGSAARLLLAAARSRDGSSANQEARLGAATNEGRDLGWGRWWTLAGSHRVLSWEAGINCIQCNALSFIIAQTTLPLTFVSSFVGWYL